MRPRRTLLTSIIESYRTINKLKKLEYHVHEESSARPIELGDAFANSLVILLIGLLISILCFCFEVFKNKVFHS